MIEATLQRIRDHLDDERRRLAQEITSYPMPIPACDAQFNDLLERRERCLHDLGLVEELARTGIAGREGAARLTELSASPMIPVDMTQPLREGFGEVKPAEHEDA